MPIPIACTEQLHGGSKFYYKYLGGAHHEFLCSTESQFNDMLNLACKLLLFSYSTFSSLCWCLRFIEVFI